MSALPGGMEPGDDTAPLRRAPPGASAASQPPAPKLRAVAAGSFYGAAAAAAMRPAGAPAAALHDPSAPGALVLSAAGDARFKPPAAAAVVLDPCLSARLRPHQREGVAFLYECVMGLRGTHTGCLLCDDMGLGKTLQVVALLWTLLKQSPAGGGAVPAVRRALVVCPASLVATWRSEVRKWLGPTRLGVAAISGGPKARAEFAAWAARGQTEQPLCITSYETLRACAAEAAAAAPGLLVCDEGHRLKSATGSKTLEALRALGAAKRVILSGTPVQNNLEEFHSLVEFVAPGALGERAAFRRAVAAPIEAARDADATPAAQRAGAACAAALAEKARAWLLRRTAEVNYKHLPPRQDYIVFCRPSPVQAAMYEALLGVPEMKATLLGGGGGGGGESLPPLVAISLLRRLCTSPAEALRAPAGGATADEEESAVAAASAAPDSPAARAVAAMRRAAGGAASEDPALSGKMAALAAMLRQLAATPSERIVLVAGWACTLDALGALCTALGLVTCRVDGATPASSRADIVRRFNFGSGGRGGAAAAARVCLLSTRAGGVGLSLVGASRLVLFDADWNPALDAQAAARVWRDGQKAPVAVYRLVTTGTLEETMLQRALVKGDVASAVECGEGGGAPTGGGASRRFALAELRQLFVFVPNAVCETAARLAAGAAPWRDAAAEAAAADAPLRAARAAGVVSFVHAPPPHGSAAALAAAAAAEPDADGAEDANTDFDEEAAAEEAAEAEGGDVMANAARCGAVRPPSSSAAAEASPPRGDVGAAGDDDDDDDDECIPESPPVPQSLAFGHSAPASTGAETRSVRPRLGD